MKSLLYKIPLMSLKTPKLKLILPFLFLTLSKKTQINPINLKSESPQNVTTNIFQNQQQQSQIIDCIVLIYSERSHKPIATGLILDDEGTFLTICNIFDLENIQNNQLYAKSMRDEFQNITFSFSLEKTLKSENICFCQINKVNKNQQLPFKKGLLNSKIPSLGKRIYQIGKSNQDFQVFSEGILNENTLSSEQVFNFSAQSLLLMSNIQNLYTSMHGSPLFDSQGHIIGLNLPNNYTKSHSIALPAYHFKAIVDQYLQKKDIKKPYLGISVQSTPQDAEQIGAFILKVNQEGPGGKAGLKLGDIITEIDGIKIKDGKDLSRIIGYNIGASFKIKIYKNGKTKYVQLQTE